MEAFQLFILALILITVLLQAYQFHDFREWRSLVIEAAYLAIIIALVVATDFLKW